jgi:Ca2+-binding EF-hand superfamily protein
MADTLVHRKRVADLLAEIARGEQASKLAKENLRALPEFNAIQIFRLLTHTEEITSEQVFDFMNDNGVEISKPQLQILFQQLDKDKDGVLSWSEFLRSCIDREFAPDNTHFVTSWKDARNPSAEVQAAFLEVLIAEFEALESFHSAKQISNRYLSAEDWKAIFEYIDKENKGHLTRVDLWNFMKSIYPPVSLSDAEIILNRLDFNKDGIVGYREWVQLSKTESTHQSEAFFGSKPSANQMPPNSNYGVATIPGPSKLNSDSSRWFQSQNSWGGSGQKDGSRGITMRSTAEKTWNGSGNLNSTGKSPGKEYNSLFSSNQTSDRMHNQEPTPQNLADRLENAVIVEERFDSKEHSSLGSQHQRNSNMRSSYGEQARYGSRSKASKSELLIEDGSEGHQSKETSSVKKPPILPNSTQEGSLGKKSKGSSARYLKPGQDAEFTERSSVSVQSKVVQNNLQEKFEKLKRMRESDKTTLERDATRGVMNSTVINEDDIFAQKELSLVPKREQSMGNELYHDSERKTAYEDAVYQASELKYNIPEIIQPSRENNSYSRFDISEGKRYGSHRNIEYISTVDRHSMKQRDELVEFYIRSIQDFRIVEQKRLNLSMRFDLRLDELFQNVDLAEGDYLSSSDLVRMFKDIQLDASEEEATLLLARFDKDRDSFLSYQEFSQIFLPFNGKFREALLTKSTRQRGNIYLYDKNTLKALRDCVASIIDAERNFEHYKQNFQGRLHELFDLIDFQHTGRLVLEDFHQVLSAHTFSATDMEISALIYRFDLNMNGEITPDEFFTVLKETPNAYAEEHLSNRGIAPNDLVFRSGKKVTTTTTKKTDYCTCICRCYTTICRGCCNCETIEEVSYTKTPCRTCVRTVTETEETFKGGSGEKEIKAEHLARNLTTTKYNFDGADTTLRTVTQSAPRVTTTYVFEDPDPRYIQPARRHRFGDRRYECGA